MTAKKTKAKTTPAKKAKKVIRNQTNVLSSKEVAKRRANKS